MTLAELADKLAKGKLHLQGGDHVLLLMHGEEEIAKFSATGATPDSILKAARDKGFNV